MKKITRSELLTIGNTIFDYLLPINDNKLVCALGWYFEGRRNFGITRLGNRKNNPSLLFSKEGVIL
jgi:hypothetical protein